MLRSRPVLVALASIPASLLAACGSSLHAERGEAAFAVVRAEGESVGLPAPMPRIRMGDEATLTRIYDAAMRDSQVMDHLNYLCGDIGPRLTGSTALDRAAEWSRDQLAGWGLANAHLSEWGQIAVRFDRGPSTGELVRQSRDGEWETTRELDFTTLSWTRGTDGPVTGKVVKMPESRAEFEARKDDLAGAWVLLPAIYSERGGVRSVGFTMRARIDVRHSIRTGEYDPFAPAENDAAAEQPAPEPTPVSTENTWTGTYLYSRGGELETTLTLDRDDANRVTGGTMKIEGFHEGPIEDVAFDADAGTLSFQWPNPMARMAVKLAVAGETMAGTAGANNSPIKLRSAAATQDLDDIETPEPDRTEEEATEDQLLALVLRQNPAGFLSPSRDERVWTTARNGWMEMNYDDIPQDIEINVRLSDYDYMNSRIADGQDIHARFDLDHTLTRGPIPSHNVIAEIPGTDLADEVVIISAHLDSWDGPGSQGTVDNGTGSAVMLEAARLLMAADARPRRTIRVILWTGEEQGLHGSKRYVESLSDEERSKISAVFVDDGGTNYQGGLPAASNMVDFLAAATAPVNGLFFSETDYESAMSDDNPDNDAMAGWMNVTIRDTGRRLNTHSGSDHAPFNAVGIPGFFWDEVGRSDYRAAWHTQYDTLDQAIEEYLLQSSVCMAMTAYNVAMADELCPRDPGPEPEEQTASSR